MHYAIPSTHIRIAGVSGISPVPIGFYEAAQDGDHLLGRLP
jgi:hypothetical protein